MCSPEMERKFKLPGVRLAKRKAQHGGRERERERGLISVSLPLLVGGGHAGPLSLGFLRHSFSLSLLQH